MPRAKKGERMPGSGRKKGVPNKLTSDLRAMALASLEAVGGQKYLEKQAIDNPVAYLTFIGKAMPRDVNLAGHDGNQLSITVKRVIVRHDQPDPEK